MFKKKSNLIIKTVAALGILVSVSGAIACSSVHLSSDDEKTYVDSGSVKEDIAEKGVRLALLKSEVLPDGAVRKSFSYAVEPQEAEQGATVSVSWSEAEKETERVENYVAATIDIESHIVSITCFQAFKTPINVRITSTIDTSKHADVNVNYVQKVTGWDTSFKKDFSYIVPEDGNGDDIDDYVPDALKDKVLIGERTLAQPILSTVYTKPLEGKPTITLKSSEPVVEWSLGPYWLEEHPNGDLVDDSTHSALLDMLNDYEDFSDLETDICQKFLTDPAAGPYLIDSLFEPAYLGLGYKLQQELNHDLGGYLAIKAHYEFTYEFGGTAKDVSLTAMLGVALENMSFYAPLVSSVTVSETNVDF